MKIEINPFNWFRNNKPVIEKITKPIVKPTDLPDGRISRSEYDNSLESFKNKILQDFISPEVSLDYIPVLRRLSIFHPEFSQVVDDIVKLVNTGYLIDFDKGVTPEQMDQMRLFIDTESKQWVNNASGLHHLINKMICQMMISGALSNEWVIDSKLSKIQSINLVNPENIRFKYNQSKNVYEPYQYDKNTGEYIKLNTKTYRYLGLGGDTDLPYGIPPLLSSLPKIKSQANMDKHIDFIIEQLGMLGFLEVSIDKPAQDYNESTEAYSGRLSTFLKQTKSKLKGTLSDGIVVGYKDEHEFKFNSIGKNIGGLPDIYNQIQTQLASGLKHPGSFLGINSGKTETHINVIFTKLLAQLNNIQTAVAENLSFGITLSLLLAGFNFKYVRVKFKPATITDELKIEQSREIKIRNLLALYNQGIINQDTFADEMGYEEPDQNEPRLSNEQPLKDEVKRKDREKGKDDSDKRVRDKNKPQPGRKEGKPATV